MKVGKLAKNGEKGQNCYPLSPRVRLVSRESSVVSRRKPPSGPVTTPHSATGRFLMVPRFVGGFYMRILCQMHVVTYSGRLSAL